MKKDKLKYKKLKKNMDYNLILLALETLLEQVRDANDEENIKRVEKQIRLLKKL